MNLRHPVDASATHGLFIHFPQKSPTLGGSFAERDLQIKASCASLPPCTRSASAARGLFIYIHVYMHMCINIYTNKCTSLHSGQPLLNS